jgi:GAF domain-containing protein
MHTSIPPTLAALSPGGATLRGVTHTRNTAELPEVVRRPSRLRALAELEANAESSAEALDRIARIACRVLDVPVVLVNLVGADRQRFVGCGGPEPWASTREMPITAGFCPFALGSDDPYTVEDARREHATNPAVEQFGVVAYAGVPLRAAGGEPIGTLCAIDNEPRRWAEDDLATLTDLAGSATAELQLLAATRTAARHQAGLQALTRLSQALATAETADDILRELPPALARFDVQAVQIVLADGSVAASTGTAQAPAAAVATGEPEFSGDVAVLPLSAGDRRLGALTLRFAGERTFSKHDREYLTALGGIAGLALARA